MSKAVRNILIIAAALFVVGSILGSIGYSLGGMKPISLRDNGVVIVNPERGELITIDEQWRDLEKIDIEMPLFDLRLEEGDSFSLRGSYDSRQMELKITENNGTLTVRNIARGNWWLNFDFSIYRHDSTGLVLTYPKGAEFREVSIKSDLGSLHITDLTAGLLNLSLDMGDLTGSDITVDVLDADLDLGSCTLNALTVNRKGEIKLDAGSLTLDKMAVNDLDIRANLGSVECSGAMTGAVTARMDMGSLSFDLDMAERDLSYSIRTDLGEIRLNGEVLGSPARNNVTSSKLKLDIRSNLGGVDIQTD